MMVLELTLSTSQDEILICMLFYMQSDRFDALKHALELQ